MGWGETIGIALIATGLSVAGVTVLWFFADAQDDPESIFGDVPHLTDELRPARREGRGGSPSKADGPVREDIARHLGKGL